ncbi:hypothetical protein A3J34_00670 [Candidatus Peribacteria bacterium RIFCSPLOWO2_02_FULL_51_10]|nr:MAG: hypothetical protein A3J34_00670 [Candidatus Peribacteria bacterium RIFCSPLOWO2_02_FULL_51_10]
MRRLIYSVVILQALVLVATANTVYAASPGITRLEGFLLIWKSIDRPAEKTSEKPFIDIQINAPGFSEVTYAKARGIIDDEDPRFYPAAPLKPLDALLWFFRTRGVEPLLDRGKRDLSKLPETKNISALADFYGISFDREGTSLSREELLTLMRGLDARLEDEIHEVSLYSEKFHGKGTAFGETFDMNALTAAHRTFPHNTLVRVTNIENDKSVVVRINDRGPFVQGRDMDMSLFSFTRIAERSLGKINARFERLGDANLVLRCNDDRFQRRIIKGVILNPGIPHMFPKNKTLKISSMTPFVVRDILYPDGSRLGSQKWFVKGAVFEFTPSVDGEYTFLLGTKTGRVREMRMEVVECGN